MGNGDIFQVTKELYYTAQKLIANLKFYLGLGTYYVTDCIRFENCGCFHLLVEGAVGGGRERRRQKDPF